MDTNKAQRNCNELVCTILVFAHVSARAKVEYGDRVEYGESRGVYKTVGDQEHLDIINTYFEGVSMGKIARKLDRSAATVHAQIHSHNESIDKQGCCTECRRLKGTHETHKTDSRTLNA